MKKVITFFGLALGIVLFPAGAKIFAQSSNDSSLYKLQQEVNSLKLGESHFMVVGLATFGFVSSSTTITSPNGVSVLQKPARTNTFDGNNFEFSPMFLWRHGKKLLIEFEPSFDGNAIGVNWACASYFVTHGLIIRGGYLVLPFGMYNKRLAAGWIDKVATDPIGLADLPPASDWGVEAEGGFQMGSMKGSYDVALTTGYQIVHDGVQDGAIQNPNGSGLTDNNNNKTISGRVSILPIPNSSLELGFSGLYGTVGDTNDSLYKDAKTMAYAVDLTYLADLGPLLLNVKGQYNVINTDKGTFPSVDTASASKTYTFTNTTTSYFGQVSLRPVAIHNKVLRNFELAFRYTNFMTPKGSLWEQHTNQTSIGLDYWLSWRSVLKLTYETVNTNNFSLGNTGDASKTNYIYLQYSVQF